MKDRYQADVCTIWKPAICKAGELLMTPADRVTKKELARRAAALANRERVFSWALEPI